MKNIPYQALCVDASCTGNPGIMEYRAVDLHTWKELFHSPIYPMGTNNLGEFLAIYDAIRYIEKKNKKRKNTPLDVSTTVGKWGKGGFTKPPYECIFTDSETALARMRSKKIKTTLKY
jgi:ribonuclease HI